MSQTESTKAVLVACVFVLGTGPISIARVIYVDDDGPADFSTIQAAIDDANDGDTIVIQPGTYTGPGNRNMDFAARALKVRSVDPNDPTVVAATIIDCRYVAQPSGGGGRVRAADLQAYRAFIFHSGEGSDTGIEGLTIINAGAGESGGAILCKQSSPRIAKCVFRANQCSQRGGAIFVEDGSPRIEQCLFEQNLADHGGALACSSIDARVYITNWVIRDNEARVSGGGLHCGNGVVVSGCLIFRNQADGQSDRYPDPRFPEGGGGVFLAGDGIELANCTIVGNAASLGGGILCGCQMDREGLARLYDSIVWDNAGGERNQIVISHCCGRCRRVIAPIELRGYHSCIQGAYSITPDIMSSSADYSGYRYYVEDGGSIHVDPRFAGLHEGDYRLRSDSPCVDTGTDHPLSAGSDTDLDGNPRRTDGDNDGVVRIDMGAYEAVPVSEPVIVASPPIVVFHVYDSEPLAQPQRLTVSNRGQGALQWTIDYNCPWLDVWPTAGGAGQHVELKADGMGLAPGTYEYDLLIHEPSVVDNPFRVPVRLLVGRTRRVPGVFATLQAAVDAAQSGDLILVADGVYTGPGNRNVCCEAKGLRIRSENGPEHCVVDCNRAKDEYVLGFSVNAGKGGFLLEGLSIRRAQCAVSVSGADVTMVNCRVTECKEGCFAKNSSLTAQTCRFEDAGLAVETSGSDLELLDCTVARCYCITCANSDVSVKNTRIQQNTENGIRLFTCKAVLDGCVISGNGRCASYQPESAIHYQNTDLYLNRCTVVGNVGPSIPNRASAYEQSSALHVVNSILWRNRDQANMLRGQCSLTFCDVQGGWEGTGNMDVDPLFFALGYWSTNGTPSKLDDDFWVDGDYHLKSQAGRWEPTSGTWVIDDVTSPCIDAGDLNSPVGDEPEPNGGRVNIGAYDGTAEASKS